MVMTAEQGEAPPGGGRRSSGGVGGATPRKAAFNALREGYYAAVAPIPGIDQSTYLSKVDQDSSGCTCSEDRQEVVGCSAGVRRCREGYAGRRPGFPVGTGQRSNQIYEVSCRLL